MGVVHIQRSKAQISRFSLSLQALCLFWKEKKGGNCVFMSLCLWDLTLLVQTALWRHSLS